MDASEQINELAAALAKAQGQIVPAKYDAQNPHLKNRYTTLAAVWDAIRKPLSENGLAVAQVVTTEPDGMYLLTRLMHSSGQYIQSVYPVSAGDGRGVSAAQAVGSALTYARRYSLTALVGVVSDDDDDGNSAPDPQMRRQPTQRPQPAQQPKPQTANGTQQAQGDTTPTYKRLPRPWPAAVAIEAIRDAASNAKHELPANGQWGALIGLLDGKPFDTQQRHRLLKDVFGEDSSKALDGKQRYALHAWAKPAKVGDTWALDANAVTEYQSIVNDNRISDEDMDGDMDAVTAGDFANEPPGF